MLNGLDLFSGIGGLAVALKPWVRPVAYCEIDSYCQHVLLSRQSAGELCSAPIWDDVTTLTGKHLPTIDIIYGGFPCQDISVAGTGHGLEGERSGLFYEVLRLAEETKPKFLFLENVPAIRTRGLDRVGKELASIGYDCRWDIVSAAECGAPHLRKRWFLLAYSDSVRSGNKWQDLESGDSKMGSEFEADVIDYGEKESLADSMRERRGEGISEPEIWKRFDDVTCSCSSGAEWWTTEPNVDRVVNGLPNRVDRIKGLGNAVVPIQAQTAFKRLVGLD